jgi:hypothetical protein
VHIFWQLAAKYTYCLIIRHLSGSVGVGLRHSKKYIYIYSFLLHYWYWRLKTVIISKSEVPWLGISITVWFPVLILGIPLQRLLNFEFILRNISLINFVAATSWRRGMKIMYPDRSSQQTLFYYKPLLVLYKTAAVF